jgi:hypothetical protein
LCSSLLPLGISPGWVSRAPADGFVRRVLKLPPGAVVFSLLRSVLRSILFFFCECRSILASLGFAHRKILFLPLYFSGRIFTARRSIVAARESRHMTDFHACFSLGAPQDPFLVHTAASLNVSFGFAAGCFLFLL